MTRRINKFLAVIILVAIVGSLFHYNQQSVHVALGPAFKIDAPLAAVLMSVFFLGALVVGLIAILVGARNSFYQWRSERKRKLNQTNAALIVRGRELLAIQAFAEARSQFQRVVQQDPSNVLAWLLLAQTSLDEGHPEAALQVLNEARISNHDNVELLTRTAQLQEKFGNVTSAYDNFTLVLNSYPGNSYILKQLVQCSLKLDLFEEAARFLKELAKRQHGAEREATLEQLADCELRHLKQRHADSPDSMRGELDALLKRHRNYAPAMVELAYIERDAGQLEKSSKLLSKAFQQEKSVQYLEPLATMWLSVNDPSRAVSTVRGAVTSGDSIEGSLFLISLYLYLEMLEDAKSEADRLEKTPALSKAHRTQLQLLRAHLLAREGRSDQVSSTLMGLIEDDNNIPGFEPYFLHHRSHAGTNTEYWKEQFTIQRRIAIEPSPQLSTP